MESQKKKLQSGTFRGKKLYIYYIKKFISYFEASHLVYDYNFYFYFLDNLNVGGCEI